MTIDDPEALAEVAELFRRYEEALTNNDLATLDSMFHSGPTTVRYGVGEVCYGIDEIRAFRAGRGGSPPRRLGRLAISTYGPDLATANVEFFRAESERRGRQSQTWVRFSDGWKIVAAHVSLEGAQS